MPQNYKNHIRFYPPHHFVFYPLLTILIIWALYNSHQYPEQQLLWYFVAGGLAIMVWIAFMMRQHYALINQNRTVRLEMRFRYYVLTQQRFELLELQLTFKQIAALRFASDAELPALVARTLKEKLEPDQIKQAIVQWTPDDMRV